MNHKGQFTLNEQKQNLLNIHVFHASLDIHSE